MRVSTCFSLHKELRLIIENRNQSNVLHNGLMFLKMRKCYDVIMKNAYMLAKAKLIHTEKAVRVIKGEAYENQSITSCRLCGK